MKTVAAIVALPVALILLLVSALAYYSFAQIDFPIPKEAGHKFMGICKYMENRKVVQRACIVYTMPNEPEIEYTAYADHNGDIAEIIKHSNKTGRSTKIWPK